MSEGEGFLSRWSRRKVQVREGQPLPEPPVATPQPVAAPQPEPVVAQAPVELPPPPTLEDAAALTPASDFTRFVAPEVDPAVKNAALKKLFADPQFNVMDGLDTYIDDYNKPDPLPESMLRQMVQAQFLGLFRDETVPQPVETAASKEPADEDADLRLQPHDAAGPGAARAPEPGAGEDPGREP